MAGQWTPRLLDLKREFGVVGHCLQAEPVKLQGELQQFTPARPSIRVLAMAGQIVLSRHRVEIANQSLCFSFCLGFECGPRGFRIRLARLAAVLGCSFTSGRGGGSCGRPK